MADIRLAGDGAHGAGQEATLCLSLPTSYLSSGQRHLVGFTRHPQAKKQVPSDGTSGLGCPGQTTAVDTALPLGTLRSLHSWAWTGPGPVPSLSTPSWQ